MIALLAMLLMIPAASATVVINGPAADRYNAGDTISVYGYARYDRDATGFLKFSMVCGETTHPLQMVPATLAAGQQALFPSDLKVPDFVASSAMEGLCAVKAELVSGSALLDWGESKQFEITKYLEGSFSIDEPRVQIGGSITLTGEVAKIDGTLVDGSAEIYFVQNESKYLVTVINFKGGWINYTHTMSAVPEGRYYVDAVVRDTFGNERTFTQAADFVLIKQLYLAARLDKAQYLPGDTVTIKGEVKNALQQPVQDASLTVALDSKAYTTQLEEGKFEGSFQIPHNAQSGRHTVTVTAKDDFGNTGLSNARLYVQAVPSKINIRLNAMQFIPSEVLEVTGTLYDQASDMMGGDLDLEVTDPDGNVASSKKISSGKKEALIFPQSAEPGTWTIKVTRAELGAEEHVTMKEHMSLGVLLDRTVLEIKNLGNVKFSDNIVIKATGEEGTFVIDSKETIKENGTAAIDLASKLPTGMYALTVETPEGQHKFSSMRIADGKSWYSFNTAYLMLVMVCVGLLSYAAYSKMPPSRKQQRKTFKMKDIEPVEPRRKFSILNIGKNKEEEMADFKTRILKDIKQAEENETRKKQREAISSFRAREDKPKEGGMFSMFD